MAQVKRVRHPSSKKRSRCKAIRDLALDLTQRTQRSYNKAYRRSLRRAEADGSLLNAEAEDAGEGLLELDELAFALVFGVSAIGEGLFQQAKIAAEFELGKDKAA
jgi:hypothetical protein